MTTRFKRVTLSALIALHMLSLPALAGPTVVPTAEGQLGQMPGAGNQVLGARFEHVRGNVGDVLLGGLLVPGGVIAPPPEFQFLLDVVHDLPVPMPLLAVPISFGPNIEKSPPASARSRNAVDDGDWLAFTFSTIGAVPNTKTIRVATFDETGSPLLNMPLLDVDNDFPFPDPALTDTSVAVDNQGRVTVVYTELPLGGGLPRVRATRFNGLTAAIIDPDFLINPAAVDSDVVLLDPAGNRLIVTSRDTSLQANVVDLSGPAPVILPEFPVATTPAGFANFNPQVAADPVTGQFTVVWDHITGVPGDPADVRGRRFDAMGNPSGNDFQVNTTTANSQGQPAVAYGPQGLSAVAWTGSGAQLPQDELDTFLQVYDPSGNPIGGEIRVNTNTPGFQDRPAVRFLPESDGQGRPQVMVAWRDVGAQDGSMANGTGTRYKCFSIEGFPDPDRDIFADGFESGDTSAWSDTNP